MESPFVTGVALTIEFSEEMVNMFEKGLLDAANRLQRDNVPDRGAGDAFFERKAHWEKIAPPSAPNKRSTQSKPVRSGTVLSNLQASVPQATVRTTSGKDVAAIKYDDEVELQTVTGRPKRSTRATKAPVRSPIPEIEKYSVTHGLGDPWDQPVVYPERDKTDRSRKQVSVEFDDLQRLDDGEWLNDSLLEYCLLYYQEQNKTQASKVYFFSNFFYSKLTAKGRNIDYEAVKRWVKDDIFTYDFVVLPICEHGHWYLVLICNLSHLERKLADDDGDVVEEVKVESPQHEGQDEKPATTSVPKGTASTLDQLQTHQMDSGQSLDSSSGKAEHKVFEDEDAMDLVGTKNEDVKQVSELKTGPNADSVSDDHAKATVAPGTKKKGKRHSTVRKYPADTPAIAILDSMPSSTKHLATVMALKDFLIAEGNAKRGMAITRDSLQGMHVTRGIPTQDNFSDCGLFVGRYVRGLLKDPEDFISKLFSGELDKIEWGSWDTTQVRATIRDQLQALAAEQSNKRKDARAERRKAKRAALPNVSIQTATRASTTLLHTLANLPPSSPTKALSPVKALSPAKAHSPTKAAVHFDGLAKPREPPRSPVRSLNQLLQSSFTPKASKTMERGVSDEPRYSARSSPAEDDEYSGPRNPIQIYEDNAQGVASEREPQETAGDEIEDDMLWEQAGEKEEEEPEWGGCDDSGQTYKNQLLAAVSGGFEERQGEVDETPEPTSFTKTSEGSPDPHVRSSPAANPASRGSSGLPPYRAMF